MPEELIAPQVGAPDPELRNSPIAEDTDEQTVDLRQQEPGEPVCYFNGETYANATYVCSGHELLRCDYGIWVRSGTCDVDNP
jgi:hypothetical protein